MKKQRAESPRRQQGKASALEGRIARRALDPLLGGARRMVSAKLQRQWLKGGRIQDLHLTVGPCGRRAAHSAGRWVKLGGQVQSWDERALPARARDTRSFSRHLLPDPGLSLLARETVLALQRPSPRAFCRLAAGLGLLGNHS